MTARRLWIGSFLAIALVNAAQLYIAYSSRGLSGWIALRWSVFDWSLWAIAWPAIAWLTRRQPLESKRLGRALAVHIPASLAFGTAQLIAFISIDSLFPRPPGDMAMPLVKFIGHEMLRRLHFQIFTYFVIVAIVSMVDRGLRASQLETRLAEARLSALKAQMQPHFLFNTLNAISALMHRDVEAAEQMVARLSDLLRLSLDTADQEIPLGRELDLLRPYLEIERIRFQDRLKVRVDVATDTRVALVPALVLQPLVENAIRHGLAPRAAAGQIDIRARREGPSLLLEVSDDGVGLTGDATPRVGLGNTRARLAELYGPRHSLEVSPREQGGVRVALSIPFRTAA